MAKALNGDLILASEDRAPKHRMSFDESYAWHNKVAYLFRKFGGTKNDFTKFDYHDSVCAYMRDSGKFLPKSVKRALFMQAKSKNS